VATRAGCEFVAFEIEPDLAVEVLVPDCRLVMYMGRSSKYRPFLDWFERVSGMRLWRKDKVYRLLHERWPPYLEGGPNIPSPVFRRTWNATWWLARQCAGRGRATCRDCGITYRRLLDETLCGLYRAGSGRSHASAMRWAQDAKGLHCPACVEAEARRLGEQWGRINDLYAHLGAARRVLKRGRAGSVGA
jgi:hypothetical protein